MTEAITNEMIMAELSDLKRRVAKLAGTEEIEEINERLIVVKIREDGSIYSVEDEQGNKIQAKTNEVKGPEQPGILKVHKPFAFFATRPLGNSSSRMSINNGFDHYDYWY